MSSKTTENARNPEMNVLAAICAVVGLPCIAWWGFGPLVRALFGMI